MKDNIDSQSFDLMDPLHELSGISMFPRTFMESKDAPNSNDPDDLASIHEFMKSVALTSPKKHLEQAKSIVDGDSEFLNSVASVLACEEKNEDVATKANENARQRRPGLDLGRRRAKFSLNPDLRQASANVEPTLDIDHIQDPEEFFLAHQNFENTRKELHLARGGSLSDWNDNNKTKTERRRRPGILGKSYRNRFSSMLPEFDNAFGSSQVTPGHDILSPVNDTSLPEPSDPNVKLQEKELTGSISMTENRVLLDELLSDECGNLDGEGLLSFLQDRLQIKPINLDKLCLPDFHDVEKNDYKDLGAIPRKPRAALSDIQNLEKRRNSKTPVKQKQVVESPVLSLSSPTPPRSPFASISLLKRRILQSDMHINAFPDFDPSSPAKNSVSVEQSDHDVQRKKFEVSDELVSQITEIQEIKDDDVGSQDLITGGESITPCEKTTNENSGRLRVIDVLSSGSDGEKYTKESENVEYNDSEIMTDTDVRTNEMEENDIMLNAAADTDIRANKHSDIELGDLLEEEAAVSSGDFNCGDSSTPYAELQTETPHEMENAVIQTNVEDMTHDTQQDTSIGKPTMENFDDESRPSAVEPRVVDGSSDAIPEQHIKEQPSTVSLTEQTPAKILPRSKRKTLSHRQSLAGFGMCWEAGVRRSKRVKMRPLEYWNGERFLYGRIHQTMTTVIGVKYLTPEKDTQGKLSMRIKSFVSDEYKELVELAALH